MASFSHASMALLLAFLFLTNSALGCTFQAGVSYGGPTVATLSAIASQDVCCFECRANPNCYIFTFYVNGTNANKCVLKSDVTSTTGDVKAVSGVATGLCAFEDGVEFPLFTSSVETDIPNKESCCNWCSTTLKCAAFTYFKSTKQCALKYAVTNRIPSPNLSTGTSIAGSTSCTYEDGFDYKGFELKTLTGVATKAACCASCKATSKCTTFSYAMSGPKAKTCVLKSSAVNRRANADAVSSRVSGLSCTDLLGIRK